MGPQKLLVRFWINWSGDRVLGWTLTLKAPQGALLLPSSPSLSLCARPPSGESRPTSSTTPSHPALPPLKMASVTSVRPSSGAHQCSLRPSLPCPLWLGLAPQGLGSTPPHSPGNLLRRSLRCLVRSCVWIFFQGSKVAFQRCLRFDLERREKPLELLPGCEYHRAVDNAVHSYP
ncbi:hypothetical protein MPH_01784 [Macrophomina phaseolina MS6]|uniref:Uncharacterized protein n=1 Tax=Macrophomina phaseolina (strain MS6) TaxID=1126212 RepID=K2SWH2_MACPH|nr:hypothetical protein MPH_01784 [Macrophomina phaseolina MS6]